jgi:SOS response regulatory protein OraA/RecX
MEDDKFKIIYNKALDILSRRDYSIKELTTKLTEKFKCQKIVNLVLVKLGDNNLIDDRRYARTKLTIF